MTEEKSIVRRRMYRLYTLTSSKFNDHLKVTLYNTVPCTVSVCDQARRQGCCSGGAIIGPAAGPKVIGSR